MLKICISIDYELFIGENFASYDEILFEPTDKLIMMLKKNGVSGCFFADVCSVFAHEQFGKTDYTDKFGAQLEKMCANNHDVQLHLHTNWLHPHLKDGKVVPGKNGYRIHEFGFGNENINAGHIISSSKQYLESVCRNINPDYKCIAYRAGGFAIQPERELFYELIKNGIRIDSSVVPHTKNNSINRYDFSDVPKKLNWFINPDKGINADCGKENNAIFEVPVASARPRLIRCIGKSSAELRLPPKKMLGRYATDDTAQKAKSKFSALYHKLFDYRYLSLDTRYYERIVDDFEYIYKKYGLDNKDAYICVIGHPKIAGDAQINNIEQLIKACREKSNMFKFVTLTDVYNECII